MHNFLGLLFFCFTHLTSPLFAQEKLEKESRIKESEVPQDALQFIDSIGLNNKRRWYKEESLTDISFETKFKHNQLKYSIEFDSLGIIEDVEIEVRWDDIEHKIKDMIASHLEKECLTYKIVKVQTQFTGSESELLSFLMAEKENQSLKKKYELIVRCKLQKQTSLFEFLYDEQGRFISSLKIVFRNSSHLEY